MNSRISENLVPLGKIIKPHGILGEIKIRLYNSNSETLKVGQKIWLSLDESYYESFLIEKLNIFSNKSRLKLKNIDNRDSAELIRNYTLSVRRDDFPEIAIQEYYINDLIGCDVIDKSGNLLGRVSEIMDNPANEILIVSNGDKEHLIPLVDDFVELFEFDKKQVTINLIDGLIDN